MHNLTDKLSTMINARSIVFVGASSDTSKWGFIMLNHLVTGGFAGPIYPVNPSGGEILGLTVYPAIKDIPGTPDLAELGLDGVNIACRGDLLQFVGLFDLG